MACRRTCVTLTTGILAMLWLLAAPARADTAATTDDGRRVLLRDDNTWEFMQPAAEPEAPAMRLQVVSVTDRGGNCVLGLTLHNDAAYVIQSIVPQFEGVTHGGGIHSTVFVAFSNVKPTQRQYKALVYERFACGNLVEVRVKGGDRCTMDELTKFTPVTGECLRRVQVVPSDLVSIGK